MNTAEQLTSHGDSSKYAIPRRTSHTLHSLEAIGDVLRKEQTRADRSGHPFCCVLFRLHRAGAGRRPFQRLFGILDRRSRVTDEVGWFDRTGLCVILPETDEPGAQCYANDILQLAERADVLPSMTIYVYDNPSGPIGGDPRATGGKGRRRTDGPLPNALGFNRAISSMKAHPVRRMEALFWRAMPFHKRLVDLFGAIAGLVLLAPLMLLIGLAIKITDPKGTILFRQKRAGLGGRPFTIFKFRTMCMDAESRQAELRAVNEQDGPAFKIKADPRVTAVGRCLRKTSLDELPQLINVVRGEMSLVGPRPATFDEIAQYENWHRLRLTVTPGITCVWQVEGRSSVAFEQWMRMDAQYIRQSSLWCDLKLLARTVPAVVLRRGAC